MKTRLAKFGAWLKQRLRLNAIGGAFAGALACLSSAADVSVKVRIQEFFRANFSAVIAVFCLYAIAELVRGYLCGRKCRSAKWDGFVWMAVGMAAAALACGLLGAMDAAIMPWPILIAAGGTVIAYKLDTAEAEEAAAPDTAKGPKDA